MKNTILFLIAILCSCSVGAQQAEQGEASYYADKFHGSLTALGEKYDKNKFTCAHRTHHAGTMLKVTRLDNGKSVIVRVNDRGPFKAGRVIDLSRIAAEEIDLIRDGVAQVKVEVVSRPDVTAFNKAPVKPAVLPAGVTAKGANPGSSPSSYDKILSEEAMVKSSQPTVTTAVKGEVSRPVTNQKAVELMGHQKKGYAVQVASFERYNDALDHVSRLEKRWFKNIFLVVKNDADGISRYRVVLGPFDSRLQATTYKDNLQRKYKMNGFLVDLSR